MACIKCGDESAVMAQAFCDACSIRMIPKIYPCPRCHKEYSTSHFEPGCIDCITPEEWGWLVENWKKVRSL